MKQKFICTFITDGKESHSTQIIEAETADEAFRQFLRTTHWHDSENKYDWSYGTDEDLDKILSGEEDGGSYGSDFGYETTDDAYTSVIGDITLELHHQKGYGSCCDWLLPEGCLSETEVVQYFDGNAGNGIAISLDAMIRELTKLNQ